MTAGDALGTHCETGPTRSFEAFRGSLVLWFPVATCWRSAAQPCSQVVSSSRAEALKNNRRRCDQAVWLSPVGFCGPVARLLSLSAFPPQSRLALSRSQIPVSVSPPGLSVPRPRPAPRASSLSLSLTTPCCILGRGCRPVHGGRAFSYYYYIPGLSAACMPRPQHLNFPSFCFPSSSFHLADLQLSLLCRQWRAS